MRKAVLLITASPLVLAVGLSTWWLVRTGREWRVVGVDDA